jgi:WhiB family redox-sensing transcriptional regulator
MTRRLVPDTSAGRPGGAGSEIPDLPCRDHDAELWFAEAPDDVEYAKALCRTCPGQEPCLAGAVERREPWGVWGGELFLAGVTVARKRRPRKARPAA